MMLMEFGKERAADLAQRERPNDWSHPPPGLWKTKTSQGMRRWPTERQRGCRPLTSTLLVGYWTKRISAVVD